MPCVTCRLCRFVCGEYKSLYDSDGGMSETLKIVLKYFHSSFLDSETEQTLKVICLECWQHISNFNSFQQWILNAQTQEEELKFFVKEEDLNASAANDLNYEPSSTNVIHSNDSVSSESDCKDNETVSENVRYKCQNCNDVFKSYVELDKHLKVLGCDRKFNEESNTKLNIIEYNADDDKNDFKCDTCGASFTQYGNLRRHIRNVHTAQPLLKWICKYCNKLFKKRSLLQAHKNRLHHHLSSKNTNNKTSEHVHKADTNLENSDAEVTQIYQEILNEEEKVENATNIQTRTLFSKEDFRDGCIELEVDNDSSSMDDIRTKQIHKPSLEIVDVKSEVATDEESCEDIKTLNSNGFNSDLEETIDNDLEVQDADLECPRCDQLIRNFKQLKEHFDGKHPDERCYINCCHTVLYEPKSILEHLRYHQNPNTFKCDECGKRFKGKKGLSSHKLQVHSEGRSLYHLHNCCCKKAVERHEKKVAKGEHMEYDKRICCQRKKKILEDDQLIAKWRNELTCEICKAKFPYYSLMRSHSYYKHPGEKCYISCCQRKMSRISDTVEHIRFHLNPHLYRCQKCNINFSGKSSLVKHMRNAHGGSLPKHRYACDECDKTFEIRFILTRHKNVCHAKKLS